MAIIVPEICPNGHRCPAGSAFCNTCGAAIVRPEPPKEFWGVFYPWAGEWGMVQFTNCPTLEESVAAMTDRVHSRIENFDGADGYTDIYQRVYVARVGVPDRGRALEVLEWRPLSWVMTKKGTAPAGYLAKDEGRWEAGEPTEGPAAISLTSLE